MAEKSASDRFRGEKIAAFVPISGIVMPNMGFLFVSVKRFAGLRCGHPARFVVYERVYSTDHGFWV